MSQNSLLKRFIVSNLEDCKYFVDSFNKKDLFYGIRTLYEYSSYYYSFDKQSHNTGTMVIPTMSYAPSRM